VIDRAVAVSYSTEHMQHDYRINTHTYTKLATRGNTASHSLSLCFCSHNRRHSRNTVIRLQSVSTYSIFLSSNYYDLL
jgi:hypothetical protein